MRGVPTQHSDGKPLEWGRYSATTQFAGERFVFHGMSESQAQTFHSRYACEARGLSSRSISTCETQLHRLPQLDQDPDAYTTAGLYTPRIAVLADRIAIEGYGFLAELSLWPTLKGTLWAADGDLLTLPLVIENYLRIVAAYSALMRGGLLIHSAGIVVDERAYLFLGRSGAGKTTVSKMALDTQADVLSDDINIVLPSEKGGFCVGAVPFAGELGNLCLLREGLYPLGGMFWLRKGKRPEGAKPMDLAVQLAHIYACCPIVNADARQMDQILETCKRIVTAQPLRLLDFNRDETFASLFARISDVR